MNIYQNSLEGVLQGLTPEKCFQIPLHPLTPTKSLQCCTDIPPPGNLFIFPSLLPLLLLVCFLVISLYFLLFLLPLLLLVCFHSFQCKSCYNSPDSLPLTQYTDLHRKIQGKGMWWWKENGCEFLSTVDLPYLRVLHPWSQPTSNEKYQKENCTYNEQV
jgi:hypothetical protein